MLLRIVDVLLFLAVVAGAASGERVSLSNVRTLVLRADQKSTARRGSPLPQLNCVKGNGCHRSHEVRSVLCTNLGPGDYGDPNWQCTSELPDGLRFGSTDISCEGYSSSDDPYVLAGSCVLEYELLESGGGRGGGSSYEEQRAAFQRANSYSKRAHTSSSSGKTNWTNWIIFGTLAYLLFRWFQRQAPAHAAGGASRGARGGGGGGGATPADGTYYGGGTQHARYRPAAAMNPDDCAPPLNAGAGFGYNGGLWNALGGMGLGYMLGRGFGGGERQYYAPPRQPVYGGGGYGGGGFGGGGGGGGGGSRSTSGYGTTRRR